MSDIISMKEPATHSPKPVENTKYGGVDQRIKFGNFLFIKPQNILDILMLSASFVEVIGK